MSKVVLGADSLDGYLTEKDQNYLTRMDCPMRRIFLEDIPFKRHKAFTLVPFLAAILPKLSPLLIL